MASQTNFLARGAVAISWLLAVLIIPAPLHAAGPSVSPVPSARVLPVQSDQPIEPVSQCLVMAQAPPWRTPPVRLVQLATSPRSELGTEDVSISFVGHSTFRIESPGGVVIATDFNGFAGEGPVPTAVTMNHAHSSHYTDFPGADIEYVLRGWGEGGQPAKHKLMIGDVLVRNVTTDIRSGYGGMEPDGNSIFIFEVAGLCLGHLGHLHHRLSEGQYAMIGRLDVLFVPVDGTYTMGHAGMIEIAKRLRASLLMPMHYFGPGRLSVFLDAMREDFDVELKSEPRVVISQKTLPSRPKVLVLPGY